MRREDYQPCKTSSASLFRKFDVKCLACGSYQLRLIAQLDEQSGEISVVMACNRCPQREVMPIKWGVRGRARDGKAGVGVSTN
jgi:hypothetical protein